MKKHEIVALTIGTAALIGGLVYAVFVLRNRICAKERADEILYGYIPNSV